MKKLTPISHDFWLCKITHLSVLTGPLSSIGSPITLIILPRVSSPTGILMGNPVSVTACPRTKPSVPK